MKIVFVVLTLALLSGVNAQAQDRIRPGIYELKINDHPVASRCYPDAEVKPMNSDARTLEDWQKKLAVRAQCSMKDFKVAGNTVSFTLVCLDHTTATTGTYRGDSFDTFNTVTRGNAVTKSHMQGRRTGDCK